MTPESTRVLVVEDNSFDQQLLKEYLSSRGYQTEFANDGTEALPKLEADPLRYDAVLTDWIMPNMNGLELLGHIKENPRLRTIPVILQTASARREEMVEGIRAGAYYYLTKPYDVEMLLTVVQTAVRDSYDYRHLKERLERGLRCLTLIREGPGAERRRTRGARVQPGDPAARRGSPGRRCTPARAAPPPGSRIQCPRQPCRGQASDRA